MPSALVGLVMNREPYSEEEMAVMPTDLTCISCGRPVPNFPEHGNTILMEGDQMCPDCSFEAHDIGYRFVDKDGKVTYE